MLFNYGWDRKIKFKITKWNHVSCKHFFLSTRMESVSILLEFLCVSCSESPAMWSGARRGRGWVHLPTHARTTLSMGFFWVLNLYYMFILSILDVGSQRWGLYSFCQRDGPTAHLQEPERSLVQPPHQTHEDQAKRISACQGCAARNSSGAWF